MTHARNWWCVLGGAGSVFTLHHTFDVHSVVTTRPPGMTVTSHKLDAASRVAGVTKRNLFTAAKFHVACNLGDASVMTALRVPCAVRGEYAAGCDWLVKLQSGKGGLPSS